MAGREDIENARRRAPTSAGVDTGADLADQMGVLRRAIIGRALPAGFTWSVDRDPVSGFASIKIIDNVSGASVELVAITDWRPTNG